MKIFTLLRLLVVVTALPVMAACASFNKEAQEIDAAPAVNANVIGSVAVPLHAPEEDIPLIQDPQYEIWIPGYWTLQGNRFVWISGKIMHRPSPTAVWSPARWVKHAYGWTLQEGHWE